VAAARIVGQGGGVDDDEVTGAGGGGPLRLIGQPVVDRADAFAVADETAELPEPAVVAAAVAVGGHDPLVAAPADGMAGWRARVLGVLSGCGAPLLIVSLISVGPAHLFAGRIGDSVIAAPMLGDLAGGVGLLLLPLMWVSFFALAALPSVLCLAGVAGVAVHWAADGRRPPLWRAFGAVLHRVGPLWAWLALIGAAAQAVALLPDGPALTVLQAAVAAGLGVVTGMLGCVALFERRRGPRRAVQLLSLSPGSAVAALAASGAALVVLPDVLSDQPGAGDLGGAALAVLCGLLWAVTALITYGSARRAEGPLTSGQLKDELAR
jgi:hypothetical protein